MAWNGKGKKKELNFSPSLPPSQQMRNLFRCHEHDVSVGLTSFFPLLRYSIDCDDFRLIQLQDESIGGEGGGCGDSFPDSYEILGPVVVRFTSDLGVEGDADAALFVVGFHGDLAGAARPVAVQLTLHLAGTRVEIVVVHVVAHVAILFSVSMNRATVQPPQPQPQQQKEI